jgi:hypothetical protein
VAAGWARADLNHFPKSGPTKSSGWPAR